MDKNLITAGEFAKLAKTTKRTVHWYDQAKLLRPKRVNSEGYRFYEPGQIIDFQVISLLRGLGFSLSQIRKSIKHDSTLKNTFLLQQQAVQKEIKHLQKSLRDINLHYKNLTKEGILIIPKVKRLPYFEIYYINRVGPYSKIYQYCLELKSSFVKIPKNTTYLTIFTNNEYLPHKDNLKIGVIKTPGMKLKKEAQDLVKKETISGFKALSYTYCGPTRLMSLIWMELRKYKVKYKIKRDSSVPFFELEFYRKTALNDFDDEENEISELYLPII